MPTNTLQEDFFSWAPGKYLDPDGVYKYQCVDVPIAYAVAIFPGISWEKTFGRGNANMHYPKNNAYWESIPNKVGDLTSFPQRGDIVIWGGDRFNEFGHIAVVLWADAYSMIVMQQNADGSARLPVQVSTIGYDQAGTGGVVGWLRPKVKMDVKPVATPEPTHTASLNGIDISSHQKGINLAALGAQFVIVKATEGVGYEDPAWTERFDAAKALKLPRGVYHFARPVGPDNSPEAEAEWFLKVVSSRLDDETQIVLDWEAENIHDTAWARKFLDIVKQRTGKTPLLYSYLNAITSHNWGDTGKHYPLWLAQYPSTTPQGWGPTNRQPTVSGWNIVMWQYSSTGRLAGYGGDLDLNVFNGNRDDWRRLATGGKITNPTSPSPVEQRPAPAPNQCIVEAGDTLSGIAAQFGTTLDALIAANPGINPDLIYPGQVLNLPDGQKRPAQSQPAGPAQCIVEAGDTLYGIAQQFGVNLQELIKLNGIQNANLIHAGQVLNLPGKAAAAAPKPTAGAKQCVVEAGDTLSGIAVQFGVALDALIAANPGINPNVIHPGQVLNLPGGGAPAAPPRVPKQCVVEAGDTLSGIAAQFRVSLDALIRANPGINPDLIHPGQVLNLP